MSIHIITCFLFCATLSFASGFDWPSVKEMIRESFPHVSQISVDSLTVLIDSTSDFTPVILDVREPEEFMVSHLPGAIRALTEDDALDILEGVPRDTSIVLYCSVGYRSSELAAQLMKQGFTNVHNLEGSLFEWANNGLPLYDDSLETTTVHPYDEEWGILLHRELWSWKPDDPDSTQNSQIK